MRPSRAPLRVLSVASEMYPLIKTGGLADVVGALPAAMAPHGIAMRTLLPGYPAVVDPLRDVDVLAHWPDWFGGSARVLATAHADLDLLVLDAPHLYRRAGNPYVDGAGHDWPDNAERFGALSLAAARIGWGDLIEWVPDLIHVHDWQTALVPAYLRFLGAGRPLPSTVLTLHNLAFQGRFGAGLLGRLGLPAAAFTPDALEYYGDIGFLKAGILLADAITTVSPTYALEIRAPAAGMGLESMLRWRGAALSGIVNGIDTAVWNPAGDPLLERNYNASTLADRAIGKRAVEREYGLPADEAPLVCMITRLTAQKGIDLVADVLDELVAAGARLVVLGSGEAGLERRLIDAAARWPARVAIRLGYDEALSHRLQAGCDAILVPSRFEPCGLTQLCGLRYGCVPVVSRVGGLADTVIDANVAALRAGVATGIVFDSVDVDGLIEALRRMVRLYGQPDVWQAMQRAGMAADVSCGRSAIDFASLYRGRVGTA